MRPALLPLSGVMIEWRLTLLRVMEPAHIDSLDTVHFEHCHSATCGERLDYATVDSTKVRRINQRSCRERTTYSARRRSEVDECTGDRIRRGGRVRSSDQEISRLDTLVRQSKADVVRRMHDRRTAEQSGHD